MVIMNNFIWIFLLSFVFFFPLDQAFSQQHDNSRIEALKNRIDEIQKQNEELIRKIQKENSARIEELQNRIDELEEHKYTSDETKKEDLDQKIKTIVDNTIESKTPSWINFGFSPDFPSYFRTRVRDFNNATFLGASSSDDNIFFIDSRLMLSPILSVGENLSMRAQLDIASNVVWGGLGDKTVSDKLYESPSPSDSFRGAILRQVTNTTTGDAISPTENIDLVDIRSLYMVAKTPVGEFYVGRQPFDWGLGLLNNAGSLPDQDLGSIVDRIELDTAPFTLLDERLDNLYVALTFDRLSSGKTISNRNDGDGWDAGLSIFYESENLYFGGYLFGITQKNFDVSGGLTGDLDTALNWSFWGKYIHPPFTLAMEFQDIVGKISDLDDPLPAAIGDDSIDISAGNILFASRLGYEPGLNFLDSMWLEFGWASGDDATTPDKLEGNTIYFNNAYSIDNLLFKHVVPNVYALEGSVINSGYLRAWSTLQLSKIIRFTPQVIFAWVDEKNALAADAVTPLPSVGSYLGTELEGTFTFKIMNNLWLDLIGSLIVSGDGLKDLMSQRAFIEGAVDSISDANPPDYPFALQARLIFAIDPIIKDWNGSSVNMERAWYGFGEY